MVRAPHYVGYMTRFSRGVTSSRLRLYPDEFLRMEMAIPPLDTQRAIVDLLDAETSLIDALVGLRRTQAVLIADRHRALRAHLVLRGLDPNSSSTTDTGLRAAKLGVFCSLQRGHDLPADQRREGPVPIVSSSGISGYHDTAACQAPGVVTGRYGTVGDAYFIEEPYWPLNTTLYVNDFRGNEPRFVKELLACLPLQAESEKSSVGGIDRKVIGDLRVPALPVDEQVHISQRLMESEIRASRVTAALERQIALLQERKQALTTAAVTGQLDVGREIAEEVS